jgi:chemotaxis signal transduction protein
VNPRNEVRKPRTRHAEAAILFAVGPYNFAIAASEVDEIRDMHGLTPASFANAPNSVRKIRYLLERERRTYHVVDASMHFQIVQSEASRILVLRGGLVALTADSIDSMTDIKAIAPLPRAFRGEETRWFRGVAVIDTAVVPVVNSKAVLTDGEIEMARAASAAEGVRA